MTPKENNDNSTDANNNAMTTNSPLTEPVCFYNNIMCPFDQFWDFSLKSHQHQEHWLVATKAKANHTLFDVTVAMAIIFMELHKDKANYYYCWGALISIPLDGDISFDKNSTTLGNGEEPMKVNLKNRVNLLLQWMKVSTLRCQQFAQWYNGADNMLLNAPFKLDPAKLRLLLSIALMLQTKESFFITRCS